MGSTTSFPGAWLLKRKQKEKAMKSWRLIVIGIGAVGMMFACSPTNQVSNAPGNSRGQQGPPGQNGQRPQGERPSIDQIFADLDANKDGLLSKDEVLGPLANDFTKLDTNKDNFLSKEELENAPRPTRRG